jgi:hypothetical protein
MTDEEYEAKRNDIVRRIDDLASELQHLEAEQSRQRPGIMAGWVIVVDVVVAGKDTDLSGLSWATSQNMGWTQKIGIIHGLDVQFSYDYAHLKDEPDDDRA